MEPINWMNVLIALCTAIGTVISITVLVGKKFDKIHARFDKVDSDLADIRKDNRILDSRLSHIEGFLVGKWEGTHDR